MALPVLLHVDPHEDDRILVARIHRLHAPPSRFVQFSDPKEAQSAVTAGLSPAVVLVASRFDLEDGVDFIRWLHTTCGPQTKVFLLTASLDENLTRSALAAGASGVVYRTSDLKRMIIALTSIYDSMLISR